VLVVWAGARIRQSPGIRPAFPQPPGNVYRFLNLAPPEELSRPILHVAVPAELSEPTGIVRAVVDGDVSSYFEWMGAGVYRVDERTGAMHGAKFLVKEVYFGSDGADLYLRIDFQTDRSMICPAWKGASASKPGIAPRPAVWPLPWRNAARAPFSRSWRFPPPSLIP